LIRFVAQWLVPIALAIFAVVDCLLTPRPFVRALPKPLWVLLILVPYVGALLWIFTGRAATPQDLNRAQRRRATDGLAGLDGFDDLEGLDDLDSLSAASGRRAPRAARADAAESRTPALPPDDDPEFLRRLAEQMRKDRPEG
jgi:hypothetical protein